MEYPKSLMTITELVEMGFSRHLMNTVVHATGAERFVIKLPGKKRKILVDTKEFDKYMRGK